MPYVKQRVTVGDFDGTVGKGLVVFAGPVGDDVFAPRIVMASLTTDDTLIRTVTLRLLPEGATPLGPDDFIPIVEWDADSPRSGFRVCGIPVPRDGPQVPAIVSPIGIYVLELKTSALSVPATFVVWWELERVQ